MNASSALEPATLQRVSLHPNATPALRGKSLERWLGKVPRTRFTRANAAVPLSNQAVLRSLQRNACSLLGDEHACGLQTKLLISSPSDPLEREADQVADIVVRGRSPRFAVSGARGDSVVHRCGSVPAASCPCHDAPSIVGQVLRAPGQPLDSQTRSLMESRLGHDFSGVRVHTNDRAAESARAVNAAAYTVGRDMVFGASQYAPSTDAGRRLLAHELTHVVQQGSATGPVIRRQETGREQVESPGFWGTVGGGLIGEFNEDPTFAMIGVDVGVSLVPVLDQASDVRDVAAHLYYMIFRNQYNRVMRWIGLVFTLIGLIPELGSAIKGASKVIIKGVREVLSHVVEVLRPFQRFAPWITDLPRLLRYVSERWDSLSRIALSSWQSIHRRLVSWVGSLPGIGVIGQIQDGLTRAGAMAPAKLREGFAWVKGKWDELTASLGRRESDAMRSPSRVDPGVDADVERAFVEETVSTSRPARRSRPTRPAATGVGAEARAQFNELRAGYAQRLGVRSGGQVHHAIELQTLERYPGAFTAAELNAFENMRGIETELTGKRQLHNSKIREIWDRHYRTLDQEIARRGLSSSSAEFRNLARSYLQEGRAEMDYLLGQFFTEYRRPLFAAELGHP